MSSHLYKGTESSVSGAKTVEDISDHDPVEVTVRDPASTGPFRG